ncbi:CdaR family protein [Geoalkalibacter subterraneus]|jgi:YbbR domain-containing protein|uniref:CdaR family protein n=1 Tax=Geoalkalibacter subterraneus TaxID=483547 RepID=UPI000693E4C2|nr:CdaR family protein [Geoalkalibacter subterraneus]
MLKFLTENWILKIVSLVFALVLWFFVIGERRVEVGYTVPLELVNVPEGLMVANEVPNLVDIRLNGPRTLLMNLSPADISISVDLTDLKPGLTSFKRLEERLNIPSGLKVTRLSPSFVDVKLERIRGKKVPVEVVLRGEPAEGYTLAGYDIVPQKVVIEGAESEIKDVSQVLTEPVDIEGIRESFTLIVPLDYQGRYTQLKEDRTVEIQVHVVALAPEPEQAPENETSGLPEEKRENTSLEKGE